MRDLREVDFHKPGIYGSGRVWANAWDVFRRASSRGGRGRRAAVDFVVCFGWGGILYITYILCSVFFFSSNAHGLLQVRTRTNCLIYLSTIIVLVYSNPAPVALERQSNLIINLEVTSFWSTSGTTPIPGELFCWVFFELYYKMAGNSAKLDQ